MKTVHPFVNKYIFITDEKYYKYGKITDNIDDEFFLIRILSGDVPTCSYSLYNIHQMLQDDNNSTIGWQFFKTKAELNKYLKWIETPAEDTEKKILQLVKKQ
jgi:hypothetical protein